MCSFRSTGPAGTMSLPHASRLYIWPRPAKHQRARKVPDLLIAAAAEARGLTVLHYAADFDRIAAVTGQPCEWVVPAGSVD